jgi:uncharacterized membrane protein
MSVKNKSNSLMNRKKLFILGIGIIVLSLQYCKPAFTNKNKEPLISYNKDIQPLMLQRCTPCHFPEQGRKEMLNTYETTKTHLNDIIHRIQLPEDDKEFMPFKSKRTPLNKEEIELFKSWLAQNMPE